MEADLDQVQEGLVEATNSLEAAEKSKTQVCTTVHSACLTLLAPSTVARLRTPLLPTPLPACAVMSAFMACSNKLVLMMNTIFTGFLLISYMWFPGFIYWCSYFLVRNLFSLYNKTWHAIFPAFPWCVSAVHVV